MSRTPLLSILLALSALVALPGCSQTPAEPIVSERYVDIELHLEPARDAPPGSETTRAWTTDDGRTLHLRHVDTIPGTEVRSVRAESLGDRPALVVELAPSGAAQLEALTTDHIARQLGLVANDRLLLAARIAGPFSDGFQVATDTLEEAERLHRSLVVSDDQ
ncbi:hypothetical protein [Luteimonas sp. RC10]|uniref:SecDF P1 head subdomain-containing protein n=1 Tax=Luteimonas sp. RC10 TaxID=2587035 RepID=UPI00160BB0C1|nr:hypothetical protein [Luteimonas sp. RC10]MBB3342487.1 preprotein translocase subunit SecD [Luteimonas sp. RC10]